MKPAVLVVDDEPAIAESLRLILEREGYFVETAQSTAEAATRMDGRDFSVALVDLVLPDGDGLGLLRVLKSRDADIEVIIMTGHGSISKAVEATKEGAFYFVTKPFDSAEMLTLLGKALERRRLLAETSDLKRQLAEQMGYGEMLGGSPTMRRVFELLDSVSASDANVFIVGESGTGKELAANAVHAKSPRAEGPLVKINCAALPKDLIESELFGHVKGAFTGATSEKPGLLEEAHKGSLLLDEISEMPPDLQAKLLRVLEDRSVRRLGGTRAVLRQCGPAHTTDDQTVHIDDRVLFGGDLFETRMFPILPYFPPFDSHFDGRRWIDTLDRLIATPPDIVVPGDGAVAGESARVVLRHLAAAGWSEPLDSASSLDDLPAAARDYVEFVSTRLDVPIELVGVGAARVRVLA